MILNQIRLGKDIQYTRRKEKREEHWSQSTTAHKLIHSFTKKTCRERSLAMDDMVVVAVLIMKKMLLLMMTMIRKG